MEFQSFSDIERFNSQVTITEKIHGTNAQVYVFEYTSTNGQSHEPRMGVRAGSRTRIITPEDDNYGFARWVHDNADGLIKTLGPGLHFGEWFGSGINSGYNLTKGEKRFALFNVHRWEKVDLSAVPGLAVVPVLYRGPYRDGIVTEVMTTLKAMGSQAVQGFMNPEGVVIRFDRNGAMFKQVFTAEESSWQGKVKQKQPLAALNIDQDAVNALYQPIRLEKLLSRDERYCREYPSSLPAIAKAYVADLEKEAQFDGVDENVARAARKGVFVWIKDRMAEQGYAT